MTEEEFTKETEKLGIELTNKMKDQLLKYYELLVEYNEKINLTTIIAKKDVYLKHFYDSLTVTKIIDLNKKYKICDVGTGAGFPGIVLKIVFPSLEITLVDALEKRIKFLNIVINELNLEKIKTVHSRIEDLEDKEKYDIVISRAVAYSPTLLELCCQLPKVDGKIILMKGEINKELNDTKNAIKTLGFYLENKILFKLPFENSIRSLIMLKKLKVTDSKYPRNYSQIKKKAL